LRRLGTPSISLAVVARLWLLVQRADKMPEGREPAAERDLPNSLLSHRVRRAGVLTAERHQPFDTLAHAPEAAGKDAGERRSKKGSLDIWLPERYTKEIRAIRRAGDTGKPLIHNIVR